MGELLSLEWILSTISTNGSFSGGEFSNCPCLAGIELCLDAVLEYSAVELFILLRALQKLEPHPELSAPALKVIQKMYQRVYVQLNLDNADVWLALFVNLLEEELNWLIADHKENAEEIHENCDTLTKITEHISMKGLTAEEFLLNERIKCREYPATHRGQLILDVLSESSRMNCHICNTVEESQRDSSNALSQVSANTEVDSGIKVSPQTKTECSANG